MKQIKYFFTLTLMEGARRMARWDLGVLLLILALLSSMAHNEGTAEGRAANAQRLAYDFSSGALGDLTRGGDELGLVFRS